MVLGSIELVGNILTFIFDFVIMGGGRMSLLYLIIACGVLTGCIGVVTLQNPIHSAFALISVFVVGMVLLVTVRAEFLALMFVIVYVGAVVVFFLFVIMMVDIDIAIVFDLKFVGKYMAAVLGYLGFVSTISSLNSGFLNCILVSDTTIVFCKKFGLVNGGNHYFLYGYTPFDLSNLERLGLVLYTDFSIAFIYTGILLFIAIIGCVVVTSELRFGRSKLQNLTDQQIKGVLGGDRQACQVWAAGIA